MAHRYMLWGQNCIIEMEGNCAGRTMSGKRFEKLSRSKIQLFVTNVILEPGSLYDIYWVSQKKFPLFIWIYVVNDCIHYEIFKIFILQLIV